MHPSRRTVVRVSLVIAALAVVSLVIAGYSARKAWADPPPPCADLECNSLCFSDGGHYNHGTYIEAKAPTLLECGNNDGTCVTKPCHGH